MAANGTNADRMAPPSDDGPVGDVSPALPDEVSDRITARVEAFGEAGVETTVREWPRRVSDPTTDRQRAAVAAFDRYRAVAGVNGVRLDPFFECRTNPDGTRTISFPVACLSLERDGNLTGLYPCYVDGDHAAIEDGLDAIETGAAENIR